MKFVRILILLLIVAVGGFLFLSKPSPAPESADVAARADAAEGLASDDIVVPETKTGMALVLMKIKNAFTGNGPDVNDQYAERDLGRLEKHFRSVSEKK